MDNASTKRMKHLFTLILLGDSLLCFSQVVRDTEPTAPLVASVAAARNVRPDTTGSIGEVYVCGSNSAKAYHKSDDCRGLARCTHAVVKVTKKEAEEIYRRVKCQMCY